MQRKWKSLSLAGLTAGAAGLLGGAQAAPVDLSDVPLVVSTTVEPNVMLLVDNSGSMNHIIWESGYDSTVTYAGDFTSSSTYYADSNGWVAAGSSDLQMPRPNGSSTRYLGNYLNYLVSTYGDGADLRNVVPNDYRMNVAKNVAKNLVGRTSGMRFGVARFDYDQGAIVDRGCGSTVSDLQSTIDGYSATTWTPLAEALYEITRYFRGLDSYFHDNTSYTSPVQYRCQKNFVIVITDGLPTYDVDIPTSDTADTANTGAALPDWDGEAPATATTDYPNFPQYSDGFQPDGNESNEGYSLFLDDIAKFAQDIDLLTSGTDNAGGSFEDEDFDPQNLATYTVGFSTQNQMLEDAAEYGDGAYFTADDEAELTEALQQALADIRGKISSSASIAANTGVVGTDTYIFQARFNSSDWSGQLLKFAFETDGAIGTSAAWDAADLIPGPSTRNIRTIKIDLAANDKYVGAPFQWASLTTEQQGQLGSEAVLDYLRGDHSGEERNGGAYRNRDTRLGDIVNSSPAYVQAPRFRYPDNWGGSAPENNAPYSTFRASHQDRTAMVYVGANDGMLHAFNASGGNDDGKEEFAYVPAAVYPNLAELANPDYSHHFYVDGSPNVGDAFYNSAWHTVLVGALKKGGQGIYALDVTNPTSFTDANVLWEFTDRNDADLGYTFSDPAIVRMQTGRWAAVFGNGYNSTEADGRASTSGHAVLFVVDIETGEIIKKIDTGAGSTTAPNGLATPAPVDLNGDYIVDYVYAGDLQGNLWKFDLSSGNTNQWSAEVLFTACSADTCTDSTRQPITVRPEVRHYSRVVESGNQRNFEKGPLVLFGTGRYLGASDVTNAADRTHSFYGVFDNGSGTTLDRADLMEQTVRDVVTSNGFEQRVVSNNELQATHMGWYLDLPTAGEMQVFNPVLRNRRIIFTTVIPSEDPCLAGGTSWLMELNALDGSRTDFAVFDTSGDNTFSTDDYVQVDFDANGDGQVNENDVLPASGIQLKIGVAPTPTVVNAPGSGKEYKITSGSSGDVEVTTENPGPLITGRHSWRELLQ